MANEEKVSYYAAWRPDDDELYQVKGSVIKTSSNDEDMYIVYREDPGDTAGEGTVYYVRNEDADPWKPNPASQSSTILDTDWVIATYSNTTYKLSGSRFKELFRPKPLDVDVHGTWTPTSLKTFYYGDEAICRYNEATFKNGIPPYNITHYLTESYVGNVGFIADMGGTYTPTTRQYVELARYNNKDAMVLNTGDSIKFRVYLDQTSYISDDQSSAASISWERGGTIGGYVLSWDTPNRSDWIRINGVRSNPTQSPNGSGGYNYTGSIEYTDEYYTDFEVDILADGTKLRYVFIYAGMAPGGVILGSGINQASGASGGDTKRFPIFEGTWGGTVDSLSEWPTDMHSKWAFEICKDQINARSKSNGRSSASSDLNRASQYYEEQVLGSPRPVTTAPSSDEDDYDPYYEEVLGPPS